jgi:hypothetical protein
VTTTNWTERSVSLRDLRIEAENLEPWRWGVFGFLKNIGVIPWDVLTMPRAKVRLNIDPSHVPAGYLASCAYEWDSWGDSQPTDFVNALDAELHPERRDFIAAILTSLGRTTE